MTAEIRIAGFRISRDLNTVVSGQRETRLTPRAMDVLCYFADRPYRLVTKLELLDTFWPDHVGGEDALAHMIREIRRAFGDDAKRQKAIQTIPKRGYRLVLGTPEKRRAAWAAPAIVATLVVAIVSLIWPATDETDIQQASLAVLPFRSLSQDPDAIYFADGLTEEIMNAVSSIPQLKVASRTSSFAFRGENIEARDVAERLGVTNLLEGSVRMENGQARIIIQLVDALADQQIWSRSYTSGANNIVPNQAEIARSVASALGIRLADDGRSTVEFDIEPVVADFYFRGRGYFRLQTRQGYEQAILMFKDAVERDPGFASGWAWLGISHALFARFYDRSSERLTVAIQAGQRAVELAPLMPEAHTALALGLTTNDQHADALREHERATQLGPNNFYAHYYAGGTALRALAFPLAAERFTRASEIDPANEMALRLLPQVYRKMGDTEREREAWLRLAAILEKRRIEEPNNTILLASGAAAFQALGDLGRAQEWNNSMVALEPEDALVLYNAACFFSKANQKDEAISSLKAAYKNGWVEWQWMESDADLDAIRDLPEFQNLIDQMRSQYTWANN